MGGGPGWINQPGQPTTGFDDAMFEKILVPTAGSMCAEAAIGYAADLAGRKREHPV